MGTSGGRTVGGMATWRHRGGTLLGVLVAAVLFVACTSEPSSVVIEDTSDDTAAAGAGELTPFAERLYGSSWEVIQAQLKGEALVAHWRSPVELGTFSFYGTRKSLSVSVNHQCGSATATIEVSDDRIVTDGFVVPVGCEHLAVFAVFAQPKIAAAFNGPRLELTGDNVSLAAEHFLSTSDNGMAPLYVVGEPYVRYQDWRFKHSTSSTNSDDRFIILVSHPESFCSEPSGVVLDPEIEYAEDEIRIAVPAAAGLGLGVVERLAICMGPSEIAISLDEARDGRPIIVWDRSTRPATAEEIAKVTELVTSVR